MQHRKWHSVLDPSCPEKKSQEILFLNPDSDIYSEARKNEVAPEAQLPHFC